MDRRGTRRPIRFGEATSKFQPSQLPGLVLWLRADLGITIATGVSVWADQSGNGNNATQGTPAAQPTYFASGGANGQAYMALSGASSQNLGGAALVGSANMTLVIVHQFSSTASAQVSFHAGASGTSMASSIDENAATERDLFLVGSAVDADAGASATTAWEAWILTQSSAPLGTMNVNGSTRSLTPNNGAMTAPTAGYTVGSRTGGSQFMTGNFAEAIIYSRVVTAGEIASLRGYLLSRYGT